MASFKYYGVAVTEERVQSGSSNEEGNTEQTLSSITTDDRKNAEKSAKRDLTKRRRRSLLPTRGRRSIGMQFLV